MNGLQTLLQIAWVVALLGMLVVATDLKFKDSRAAHAGPTAAFVVFCCGAAWTCIRACRWPLGSFCWCAWKIAGNAEWRREYALNVRALAHAHGRWTVWKWNSDNQYIYGSAETRWMHANPQFLWPHLFCYHKYKARQGVQTTDLTNCGTTAIFLRDQHAPETSTFQTLQLCLESRQPVVIRVEWKPSNFKVTDTEATDEFGIPCFNFWGHVLTIVKHSDDRFQIIQTFLAQYSLDEAARSRMNRVRTRVEMTEWLNDLEWLCKTATEWTRTTTECFFRISGGICVHLEGSRFDRFFQEHMKISCQVVSESRVRQFLKYDM